MTREELEEGLRLQAEAARSQSRLDADIFDEYMAKFHDELLSLAEEARWRNVETEPPPKSADRENMLIVRLPNDHITSLYWYHGAWFYDDIQAVSKVFCPTHWRLLPKGPER